MLDGEYMKKSVKIIIGSIIIALIICISTAIIYNTIYKKIDIQKANEGWTFYDESITNIKNNMSAITEPNENFEWGTLKNIDIEDTEYKNTLNSLIASVRMCYLEYTDDGTLYTDSNPIRKYRSQKSISKQDLKQLTNSMFYEQNKGCLSYFEKYNALLISNDETLKNKVYSITNPIVDLKSYGLYLDKETTYDELMMKKILEVHLVEDISKFLVNEYNRLK